MRHEILDTVLETSYGAAVNFAAARARGKHLVVMRGETLVDPDWLDPLVAAAARWEAVVTPSVVGLDGAVISAGYLATRQGELVALGRGSVAVDPFWSFFRDVSCPSPSCFVVDRAAFLAAGGFDRSLSGSPLVETADFAFAMRAHGRRTLFHPTAVVRSAAEPPDPVTVPLGDRFRQRWRGACALLPSFTAGAGVRGRVELRDAHATARILVVDDRVPHVDRGGGDPRMHRILMEIADAWPSVRVTLFALTPDNGALYAAALREAGIEVVYGEPLSGWLESRACFYDAVVISRPRPALDTVRANQPQARIIYDMEAVHFRRCQRAIPLAGPDQVEGLVAAVGELLSLETRLVVEADSVWCVSEPDRTFAREIAPATPAFMVGHACDGADSVPPFDQRRDLVFYGAFWSVGSPNEDAALYLARRIMPLIAAVDPAIRLVIVGADPTPAVLALDGTLDGSIVVRGYVSNPADVLRRARVLIAPLRIGAGIKLRLIDAMAAGLPFVTTAVGAEGLPLGETASHLVGETPIAIAQRTLGLYNDRDLWTRVQQYLRGLAEAHYSRAALRDQLKQALTAVGCVPPDRVANSTHAISERLSFPVVRSVRL
jgi:glycosyltransferase involved in cell wall biosynthesis